MKLECPHIVAWAIPGTDAHWADPSSLELFDTLVSQITELPILLVISFRPEFVSSWIGLAASV